VGEEGKVFKLPVMGLDGPLTSPLFLGAAQTALTADT